MGIAALDDWLHPIDFLKRELSGEAQSSATSGGTAAGAAVAPGVAAAGAAAGERIGRGIEVAALVVSTAGVLVGLVAILMHERRT